ncbi:MAG: biopolymer transporter ExbD [Kofleriaceae bacterium]|nr:biopolymer transporter ExbD [Kofleriaceae bacterium]
MRTAVRRREDQIESDEMESGELNLVPYLDIVTNLMLVFLSAVSSGIIFSQINTTLPDSAAASTASTQKPEEKPEDQPLKLVVSITREQVLLWSITGLEGTLLQPKATFKRSGRVGDPCDGGYMCETGSCDIASSKCITSKEVDVPVFEYEKISEALFEIANRRYLGRNRGPKTYQITLMADGGTPYSTIVSMMGAMRCKMPKVGKNSDGCLLPTDDAELKKAPDPIALKAKLFDTTRAKYDPNTMALFPEILFSTGFE